MLLNVAISSPTEVAPEVGVLLTGVAVEVTSPAPKIDLKPPRLLLIPIICYSVSQTVPFSPALTQYRANCPLAVNQNAVQIEATCAKGRPTGRGIPKSTRDRDF
jgi:hypothetical protein